MIWHFFSSPFEVSWCLCDSQTLGRCWPLGGCGEIWLPGKCRGSGTPQVKRWNSETGLSLRMAGPCSLWQNLTGMGFVQILMLPNLHIFCLLRFCTLQGMRVLSIFPNSPAEAAGLVPNKAAAEHINYDKLNPLHCFWLKQHKNMLFNRMHFALTKQWRSIMLNKCLMRVWNLNMSYNDSWNLLSS